MPPFESLRNDCIWKTMSSIAMRSPDTQLVVSLLMEVMEHMARELAPLAYAFDALEPHIDAQTMEIHHDKHHQTYVTNLNNAVAGTDLESVSSEDLVKDLALSRSVPATALF